MIFIHLPTMPPSENNAYHNLPRHGRKLTKAAEKYKKDTTNHIVRYHATQTQELKKDAAIGVFLFFGFKEMYTKTKKAKHRFIRHDVLNRPKLLLDAIVEATAIDDSQLTLAGINKYQASEDETRVYIWNEDETDVGARLISAFSSIIGCGT